MIISAAFAWPLAGVSPTLLAWQEQILSLKFSVLEIASVMYAAMDALVHGREPADAWEQPTWNLADRGPFRVAMMVPSLSMPSNCVVNR